MTANILMNIEAGRRQMALMVDELFRIAYALDVPPEYLLAPRDNETMKIVPGVAVGPQSFLRWVRGQQPLGAH